MCCEVKTTLQSRGVGVRVVSVPCWELLERQDRAYQESLFTATNPPLPAGISPLRVYAEASSTLGFHRLADVHVGMTTFGASGNAKDVKKHFGFDSMVVVQKVMEALQARSLMGSFKMVVSDSASCRTVSEWPRQIECLA